MASISPQEEATSLFLEILRDLTTSNRDILIDLRRCLLACQLLDWEDQRRWIQNELEGYPSNGSLPYYRTISGTSFWRARAGMEIRVEAAVESQFDLQSDVEAATLQISAGVPWLLHAARTGYEEATGETAERMLRRRNQVLEMERIRRFPAASFAPVIHAIEHNLFTFASQSYSYLKYGSAITDIWTGYRMKVDAKLHELGLTDHLKAVESALRSSNSEEWRTAMLECRNVLRDVADYVWRDERPLYDLLPGQGEGGRLQVNSDKYVNRLAAYIHQRTLRGKREKFLRDELERLATSIRTLTEFQSKGHEPVTLDEARSAALSTYFILGELMTTTDMQPVDRYRSAQSDGIGGASSSNT